MLDSTQNIREVLEAAYKLGVTGAGSALNDFKIMDEKLLLMRKIDDSLESDMEELGSIQYG